MRIKLSGLEQFRANNDGMARSSALYNQITHTQLFKYSQPGPAFYYPGYAFIS